MDSANRIGYEKLTIAGDDATGALTLVVSHAAPGSPTADVLGRLADQDRRTVSITS